MTFKCKYLVGWTLLLTVAGKLSIASPTPVVSSQISCGSHDMTVDINSTQNLLGAHIYGLKDYPDGSCQPEKIDEKHLRFRLSFKDFYRCGTTQILNKLTGTRTFYNRLVIESEGQEAEEILVKCQHGNQYAALLDHSGGGGESSPNHLNATVRRKRDVLPAGFKEDPNLVPITEAVGRAPDPMLTMIVKKDGRQIGQELLVQPGAPLVMEIGLDSNSKDIYGILLSQLDATDTGTQSEILFHNGCSVDSYLFENFNTDSGDLLSAKFKAFKFPDTNYVLFRGTVNVCLNSCKGIECSNGQTGYGKRKRRDLDNLSADYEIHTTTILQIANPPASPPSSNNVSRSRSTNSNNNVMQTQNSLSFVPNSNFSPVNPTITKTLPNPIIVVDTKEKNDDANDKGSNVIVVHILEPTSAATIRSQYSINIPSSGNTLQLQLLPSSCFLVIIMAFVLVSSSV